MSILMRRKSLFVAAVFAAAVLFCGILFSGETVSSQPEDQPASAWLKRCNDSDTTKCEIFQKLVVKDSGLRLVEFAIGFPEQGKSARGVMILPLGILLTEDVRMQIDGGQELKFKVRFCTQNGCVAFINLNNQLLDIMRKGEKARVAFKVMNGQDSGIEMPLSGFGAALDGIS